MHKKVTIYLSFSDTDPDKEWINKFIENFKFSYKKVIKVPVELKVKGVDFDSIALLEEITPTDIFIVILSQFTANDEKYYQELTDICKIAEINSEKDFVSIRIFKVLLLPNNEVKQPSFLEVLLGYNFYETSGRRNTIQKFNFDESNVKTWSRILDLVYDINDEITAQSDKNNSALKQFVYLGNCSTDKADNRDDIRRELQHYGLRILPVLELPREHEKIQLAINNCLDRCTFIIQILGEQYGNMSVEGKFSILDIENQSIRHYIQTTPGKKRLIWIPANNKVSDPKQELYINRVKRDDSDLFSEVIEASPDEFKNILASFIQKGSISNKSNQPFGKVYLISKPMADVSFIETLAEKTHVAIIKENNVATIASYQQHLQMLEELDHVIIYYSENDTNWLKSKLGDIIKALGKGRQNQFKGIAVISNFEIVELEISSWIQSIKTIMVSNTKDINHFLNKTLE